MEAKPRLADPAKRTAFYIKGPFNDKQTLHHLSPIALRVHWNTVFIAASARYDIRGVSAHFNPREYRDSAFPKNTLFEKDWF